jgi:hypothetical protein
LVNGFIDHFTHHLELCVITLLLISALQTITALAKLFPVCCVFTNRPLSTALTVELLQLHALTPLLSGEYPETELFSSQPNFQLSTYN